MTRILIDPNELNAAASTLGACAKELADTGSQLSSNVGIAMPAAVEADLSALMRTADQLLDQLGAILHREAVGLARRSVVASLDSLAAATGSTRELTATRMGVDLVAIGVAPPVTASPLTGTISAPAFASGAAAVSNQSGFGRARADDTLGRAAIATLQNSEANKRIRYSEYATTQYSFGWKPKERHNYH